MGQDFLIIHAMYVHCKIKVSQTDEQMYTDSAENRLCCNAIFKTTIVCFVEHNICLDVPIGHQYFIELEIFSIPVPSFHLQYYLF